MKAGGDIEVGECVALVSMSELAKLKSETAADRADRFIRDIRTALRAPDPNTTTVQIAEWRMTQLAASERERDTLRTSLASAQAQVGRLDAELESAQLDAAKAHGGIQMVLADKERAERRLAAAEIDRDAARVGAAMDRDRFGAELRRNNEENWRLREALTKAAMMTPPPPMVVQCDPLIRAELAAAKARAAAAEQQLADAFNASISRAVMGPTLTALQQVRKQLVDRAQACDRTAKQHTDAFSKVTAQARAEAYAMAVGVVDGVGASLPEPKEPRRLRMVVATASTRSRGRGPSELVMELVGNASDEALRDLSPTLLGSAVIVEAA